MIASIERELHEETGLIAAEATTEGMLAAFDGPRVSIGRVLRFPLPAEDLVSMIMAELSRQQERELERVIAFRAAAELDRPEVTAYSRAFAARLLPGLRSKKSRSPGGHGEQLKVLRSAWGRWLSDQPP